MAPAAFSYVEIEMLIELESVLWFIVISKWSDRVPAPLFQEGYDNFRLWVL